MSLINKMLQDLDARHAGEAGSLDPMPQIRAAGAVDDDVGSGVRLWLIALFGVLLIVVASLAVLWWYGRQPSTVWQVPPQYFAPAAQRPMAVQDAPLRTDAQLSQRLAAPAQQSDVDASPAAVAPDPAVLPAAPVASAPVAGLAAVPTDKPIPPLPPGIKKMRPMTAEEQAESAYQEGVTALQHGNVPVAEQQLRLALELKPGHGGARQALVAMLVERKRLDEAAQVARSGLQQSAQQPVLAMILARLQLEQKDRAAALNTLKQYYPGTGNAPADYEGFYAALLQQGGQHDEAVQHYQQALQQRPQQGSWWMGAGLSLQALGRNDEARSAFERALQTNTLSPELTAYVRQRMGL